MFSPERVTTTFWQDFSIADAFGVNAIKDTYKRAFNEWKSNYKYLTELVMVLNHKCWWWHEKNNEVYSNLYADLYYKADGWAVENLKGEEATFYFKVTD